MSFNKGLIFQIWGRIGQSVLSFLFLGELSRLVQT